MAEQSRHSGGRLLLGTAGRQQPTAEANGDWGRSESGIEGRLRNSLKVAGGY